VEDYYQQAENNHAKVGEQEKELEKNLSLERQHILHASQCLTQSVVYPLYTLTLLPFWLPKSVKAITDCRRSAQESKEKVRYHKEQATAYERLAASRALKNKPFSLRDSLAEQWKPAFALGCILGSFFAELPRVFYYSKRRKKRQLQAELRELQREWGDGQVRRAA
jgi:hypothetical protein